MDVKSGDEMDIGSVIHQQNFEQSEEVGAASAFGFGSSNIFPSFNNNLPPSTLSINNNATHPLHVAPPSFPPYSAVARWRSHLSAMKGEQEESESKGAMREMIYRIAAMQPIEIDPEAVKQPKRRNVKISKDPQSVAARHRRERISQRIRILQRIVPGGTKMDTASMLDEAIHYLKFLKNQLQSLQIATASSSAISAGRTTSTSYKHSHFAQTAGHHHVEDA